MSPQNWSYLTFGIILFLAVIFDLGLLSKKSSKVTLKQALYQTIFWVMLALGFFIFIWFENGSKTALEYLSAYLMEWSLSIDNIFVFILIFTFFGVKEKFYGRVLLIGILMAIVFRVLFITIGVVLVTKFDWILILFGLFLIYTGFKMFYVNQDEEFNLNENKVYRLLKKILPITTQDANGKYSIKVDGKRYFTMLFVVIILLASTDIVFALDSIPAVFAISQDKLVIYTSNIFAVLGLRSLFFLLRGAVSKFDYLQQGIAVVLVFIGFKMMIESIPIILRLINKESLIQNFYIHIPVWVSLLVIISCIGCSILYSIKHKKKHIPKDVIQ